MTCFLINRNKEKMPCLTHDWTLPNRMTLAWWLQQRAIFDQFNISCAHSTVYMCFQFLISLHIRWKEFMWNQILQCVLWELLWPYISMWHKGRFITPRGNSIHPLGVSTPQEDSYHQWDPWSHFLLKGKILGKTSLFELLYIVVFML